MKSMDFKSLKERADADNFALLEKIIASLPRHSGFIAGGAIRRTITGEDLEKGDIDFFFRTPEDLEKYKQLLLTWKNVKFISSKDHVETFELTYGGKMSPVTFGHVEVKIEIQLIKIGYYPTAEDLLNSFDYTIAQFAIAPSQEIFYHGDFSLYDLGRKRIAVHKITYPLASLRRLIKYTNQGYYACQGCLQTYIEELRAIPDKDFKERKITYVD